MYNPNRQPARSIDPFTLLAEYRLNALVEQAWLSNWPTEEQPMQARRQSTGGLWAIPRSVVGDLVRLITGAPAMSDQVRGSDI